MNLMQCYITKSDCYKAGRTIVPKGIMLHSTATPGLMAEGWYKSWNRTGLDVAVHAFADDKIVCQHLPWNHRAWHCAGQANNTHIAFELCEPAHPAKDDAYFAACYANGVELAAYLCNRFGLKASQIISHAEGHALGLASNHVDPNHWWKYYRVTMDDFRTDVAARLKQGPVKVVNVPFAADLRYGDAGDAVRALQRRLNELRARLGLAFAPLAVDGQFGAKTEQAVRAFQTARHLLCDGVVGAQTRAAMAVAYGDVNGDGKADAADALAILQAAVGKRKLNADEARAADLNADGKVDARDAQTVLRQAVKKP